MRRAAGWWRWGFVALLCAGAIGCEDGEEAAPPPQLPPLVRPAPLEPPAPVRPAPPADASERERAPDPAPTPGPVRDANGRLVRLVTAGGREWRFERDEEGRVVLADGPAGPTLMAWTPDGRLRERSDPSGRTVRYAYDAAGRAVVIEAGALRETQTWDERGRLVEVRSGREALRWTYGAEPMQVSVEDLGAGVTLRYGGDELRQTVDTPFGRTVWLRDQAGKVVGIETPAGRFTCARGPDGVVVLNAPNGVITRLSGGEGRDALVVSGPASELLQQERAIDRQGRVVGVTRDGVAREASYDEAGRLVAYGEQTWSWDADGNRLGAARGGVAGPESAYDRRGRLLARGRERFVHDAAGRLLLREGPDGAATRYEWDGFGRLAAVTRPDGARISYVYDGQSRVATRTVHRPGSPAQTTRLIWEGRRLLAERGPGGHVRQWVQGPGIDEPLAYRDDDGAWTYLHGDRQGHVLAYSDAEGRPVDAAAFDPWGQLEQAPAAGRPVIFAGRVVDPDTGLVHMRARWYDPGLGRFLTPDPAGLGGGENAYAYVRGDPLSRIDPLGLWDVPPDYLMEPLRPWVSRLPREQQEAVADLAIAAWSALDPATRARLQTPMDAALWASELDRKVAEQVRGIQQDHRELSFLLGEAVGLVKGTASMVIGAIKEGLLLAKDTVVVGSAWVHDLAVSEDDALLQYCECDGALADVFARGEQWGLLPDIVLGLPERFSEALDRVEALSASGHQYAAGEVFGETILTETAAFLALAEGGVQTARAVGRGTAALGRGVVSVGRLSRAEAIAAFRAALRRLRPGKAAAGAAAEAETAAAKGAAEALAEAPRPLPPEPPPAAPGALEPAPVEPPPPPQRGIVQALGEEAPGGPPRTQQARAPPKPKTRGEASERLSENGLSRPEPLQPGELAQVRSWEKWLGKYLKRWRERDVSHFPKESRKLLKPQDGVVNAIKDHLKPDDMAALLKENRGVEIRPPDGPLNNHLQEVANALDSVRTAAGKVLERIRLLERTGEAVPGELELLREKLGDYSRILDGYPRPDPARLAEIQRLRTLEKGRNQ